ncbi:MAG: hypothetical protein KBT35_01185 [Firmicutes bacterium]|nr:hypothetical protein [Candidatus Colivicinus equi]
MDLFEKLKETLNKTTQKAIENANNSVNQDADNLANVKYTNNTKKAKTETTDFTKDSVNTIPVYSKASATLLPTKDVSREQFTNAADTIGKKISDNNKRQNYSSTRDTKVDEERMNLINDDKYQIYTADPLYTTEEQQEYVEGINQQLKNVSKEVQNRNETENVEKLSRTEGLAQEDLDAINQVGVLLDEEGNIVDENEYLNKVELYNKTNESINKEMEKLSDDYSKGLIDRETLETRYAELKAKANENKLIGDKLNNYQIKQGFDWYDWARENGVDTTEFEKYVSSMNDPYIENLGKLYAASLVDMANILPQYMEILETINDPDYDFTSKNTTSSKLSNYANELREYAFAGTGGANKWSLECLSSLMPMVNATLVGMATGGLLGVGDVTKFASNFTNVTLGLQGAGETVRQRLQEGSDLPSAVVNGIVHGTITGLVEGLDAGKVASLFTGDAGKFLTSAALMGDVDYWKIAGFLNSIGASEGTEEVLEDVFDYVADMSLNTSAKVINSLTGSNLTGTNVDKLDPNQMAKEFVMAYAGSLLLGAPTAVSTIVDTKAKYNSAMEARKFFESTLSSKLSSIEEKQMAQNAINAIDIATGDYTNKSMLADAIELASEHVDPLPTYDEAINNLANAVRQDVQGNLRTAQEVLDRANKLYNDFQNALNDKGYNISADTYLDLDEKTRNDVKTVFDFGNETGIRIAVVNNLKENVNGYFDNGTIVIDATKKPIITTLAHELTHGTESSKYYETLDQLVSNRFGTKEQVDTEVNRIKKLYNRNLNTKLDYNGARKEFVAKQIESLLNDSTFIRDLVNYNSSLASRIYQRLDAFISNDEIKNIKLAFEDAFREFENNQEVQYSINEDKKIDNRSILDANYSQKEIDITHNNGDYIEGLDYTIEEFLNKFGNNNEQKLLWLGKINKGLVDKIKADTGINLQGRSLVLSSDNFSHLKKHNQNNYSKYGNPKPITIATLNNLANILNNYDKVELVEQKGQTRLRFETDTNNNYFYRTIELVPKRNKSSLLVSIYTIKKGDLQGLDANNASNFYTSADDGNDLNFAPVNNISNNNKNVKYSIDTNGYNNDSSYQGTSAFNGMAPSNEGWYSNVEEAKEAYDNGKFEGDQTLDMFKNYGIDNMSLDFFLNDQRAYRNGSKFSKESIANLRKAMDGDTITMYRSVPFDVKENYFRNGDWITPSRSYAIDNAEVHGWDDYRIIENEVPISAIWWDGNDINEWGYDDGNNYLYKNTPNNRKLADEITYDDNGQPIPQSERYNSNKNDIRYSIDTNDVNVQRFTDNIEGSAIFNDEQKETIRQQVAEGKFNYAVLHNNKQVELGQKRLAKKGVEQTYKDYMANGTPSLTTVIDGELLVNELAKNNDSRWEEVAGKLADDATLIGQALQAYSILQRLTPEGQLVSIQRNVNRLQQSIDNRYGNKAPDIGLTPEEINSILNAKNAEELENARSNIENRISNEIPKTFRDYWNAWRYLAMLGNPRTHIRNIVGNAIFVPAVNLKNAIGVGLEKAFANSTDFRTKALLTNSAEDKARLELGKTRYEETRGAISKEKYERSEFGNGTIGKLLNKASNFNSTLMDKEDLFFSKSRYAKSYAEAMKANNLTEENMTPELEKRISEYAMLEAQKATYRDANSLAEKLNGWQNSDKKGLRMASFFKDALIPFTKTPMNIIKRGVEYSPAGLIYSLTYGAYELNQGKIDAAKFLDNIASGASGSVIMAIGAWLASMGLFRTKDDDNDRKNYFDQENGEQDYAIDLSPLGIEGTYTIDWATPVIMPFAMGAELYNALTDLDGLEGFNVLDAVLDISAKLQDPIMETSMLSSLQDALKSYANSGGEWMGNILMSMASSYVLQFFPTIGGQIARTIDDTRRTTYPNTGLVDKTIKQILNKIPFASKLNQPYINKQGEEEKTEDLGMGVFGRMILNMLSPGYYSSKDVDKYDEEMYRLYDQTGNVNVLPSSTSSNFTNDGIKYEFDGEEYTQFHKDRYATEQKYVNDFIDSEKYQTMNDEERADVITNIRKYAQKAAKKNYLESIGVEMDDSSYDKMQGAINQGIDIYEYFGYSAMDKQEDKVRYLEDTDLTKAQKEYLYGLSGYKTSYQDAYKKIMSK